MKTKKKNNRQSQWGETKNWASNCLETEEEGRKAFKVREEKSKDRKWMLKTGFRIIFFPPRVLTFLWYILKWERRKTQRILSTSNVIRHLVKWLPVSEWKFMHFSLFINDFLSRFSVAKCLKRASIVERLFHDARHNSNGLHDWCDEKKCISNHFRFIRDTNFKHEFFNFFLKWNGERGKTCAGIIDELPMMKDELDKNVLCSTREWDETENEITKKNAMKCSNNSFRQRKKKKRLNKCRSFHVWI